jgi:hypothetical protein
LCLFISTNNHLVAQTNFIKYFSENELNDEQMVQYQKFTALNEYSTGSVIKIAPLSSIITEGGKLPVELRNNSECGRVEFSPETSRYIDDNNYYYYARYETPDSCKCKCQDGEIMLDAKDGKRFGFIRLGKISYEIWSLGTEFSFLGEVNPTFFEGKQECKQSNAAENKTIKPSLPKYKANQRTATACIIRVLFIITPEALTALGNSGVADKVNTAINQTNQALMNSNINNVCVQAANTRVFTGFTQAPADINDDVFIIQNSNLVAQWRNTDLADVVCLVASDNYTSKVVGASGSIPNPNDPVNPINNLGNPQAALAFMALTEASMTTNYTFSHELGHIMGCRHQDCSLWSNPGCDNNGIDEHGAGWGYRKCWLCPWKNYGTILHQLGGGTRLLHYSNPDVNYLGNATGTVNLRDNARWIRENHGCMVAGYFAEPIIPLSAQIDGSEDILCKPSSATYFVYANGSNTPFSYQWSISTNGANWGNPIGTGSSITVNSANYSANSTVFLRVRVQDATGNFVFAFFDIGILSPSNPKCKFIPKLQGLNNNSDSVSVAPNPVEDDLNVILNVDTDNSPVIITLISMTGQKQIEIRKELNVGVYSEKISMKRMNTGSYVIQVQIGERIFNRLILKN